VRAATSTRRGALFIPQRAVTELQGSYQVAVVGGGNKIEIRTVKSAELVGTMWIVEDGLKPVTLWSSKVRKKVTPGAT